MKTKFLLLLSFTAFIVNAQIPSNGLVAYFPFFGNALDSSVNKTHGTVTNAVLTTDRFGNPNAAYQFNGNSYIEFSSTYVKNNRYTYSIWAKINTLPANGAMAFALNIGGQGGDQSLNIANNYSGGMFNGWLGGGYNTVAPNFALQQSANLSNASWSHVVCVRDSNYAKLYINGVLVDSIGSSSVKYPSYGSGQTKAYIGIRYGLTTAFNGKIDDICIYNRALSKQEVLQLYNDQSTSVQSVSLSEFNIDLFPNPALNKFELKLLSDNLKSEELDVRIFNSLGQEVNTFNYSYNGNSILFDNNFVSGLYTIHLLYDNRIISVKKLIIQ